MTCQMLLQRALHRKCSSTSLTYKSYARKITTETLFIPYIHVIHKKLFLLEQNSSTTVPPDPASPNMVQPSKHSRHQVLHANENQDNVITA
jgi:hypothetical protein